MSESQDITLKLQELENCLSEISKHLEPLFQYESLSELNSQLLNEEALRLNTGLAYTLYSVYYSLLRTYGKDLSHHPVKQEIERVREFMTKVQDALNTQPRPEVRIDRASTVPQQSRQLKGSTPLPEAPHLRWKTQVDQILGKK